MTVRGSRWVRVSMTLGLVIGSSLFSLSGRALAQPKSLPSNTYLGDSVCGLCHQQEFAEYAASGHPWMQVHVVGGKQPDSNLFAPIGLPVPALPAGVTWDQVQDIVANFKPAEAGEPTPAAFLLTTGFLKESNGGLQMPGRCNKCHNTGGIASGTGGNVNYPNPNINGSWVLNGVQCEQCHGPNGTMTKPGPNGFVLDARGNPIQISDPVQAHDDNSTTQVYGDCRDCHSSGDSEYRIPFSVGVNPKNNFSMGELNNHHPQGDEYRRSPHKNEGCTLCHDPHLSVWRDLGGVVSNNGSSVGQMCTNCHSERVQANNFPTMSAGIECTECHMPKISAGFTRTAHLFRINGKPVSAAANTVTEMNDSGKPTSYWKNADGTTGPNGDSFLTLDLVCTNCHFPGSSLPLDLQTFSSLAPFIHRANGMTYIQANWQTDPLTVSKTQPVTVAFSIIAGRNQGKQANSFVLMYGPKGWSSWNGKKWVPGQHAWKTHTALSDIHTTIPFDAKLPPGAYTFYVKVQAAGQTYNSYVKVKVTK